MKTVISLIAAMAMILAPAGLLAQAADPSPLDESLSKLSEWVQVRSLISEEKADWEIEKLTIEDIIVVFEKEISELDEQIKAAEEVTSQADEKRLGLLEERDALRDVAAEVAKVVAGQERAMKLMLPRLPEPLLQEIKPLVDRLPKDPDDTTLSLSQRMQNLVGILAQVDKFNGTVDLVVELREFGGDNLLEVKTLYFGLGAAYYVDGSGQHAGIGTPGDDGWVWEERPDLIPLITELVGYYEGVGEPAYVTLPVNIIE